MAPLNWLLPLLLTLALPALSIAELWGRYTRGPESVITPLGDEIVFACQTNNPVERVVWWHRQLTPAGSNPAPWRVVEVSAGNNRNSDSPYKINVKSASSRLTVKFINESLAGDYMCVSWNGASALASVYGRLSMPWMKKPGHGQNQHLRVAPGSKVLLRCPTIASEPPATIFYYKMVEGNPIKLSNNGINGNLVVHAKGNSSVVYTCTAHNSITEEVQVYNHRITVDIDRENKEVPPTFVKEMMLDEVIGKEGSSISIGCAVAGIPAPRINWKRKDGMPLPDNAQPTSLVLQIPHLKIHDKGDYVCDASNAHGRAKTVIRLRVRYAARIDPVKPDGAELPQEEIVQEGASVRLHCGRVSGEPKPLIYWLINGAEVTHDKKVKILDDELEINSVEKRHSGVVQCFATNILGSDYSATLLRVSPKQLSNTEVLAVTEKGDKDITRPVHKASKPTNGRHRKGGIRKEMVPPSRPDVTRLSDESVMVRWTLPHNNGLRIQFFKVQYRDLNMTGSHRQDSRWNTTDQNIDASIHSYEVAGLTAGHVYRFRIAAVYSNDDNTQGQNSAKFLLQRGSDLAKGPPLAPIFSRAEAVSTTSIRLHWQLEVNMDESKETAPVEGFYIYYRQTISAGEYMNEPVEGNHTREHILNHLVPGGQYEIKLQSFNRIAASAFSKIINQGTLRPPSVEKSTEPISAEDNNSNTGQVYGIAGGAVGGAALLVGIILTLLMCKRRRECEPDKPEGGNVGGLGSGGPPNEGINGYLPSAPPTAGKPIITITPNPLHAEQNENLDLEMSYYSAQNNNCSTATPRSSVEMPPNINIPTTCREELRKRQSPLPMPLPARENYV